MRQWERLNGEALCLQANDILVDAAWIVAEVIENGNVLPCTAVPEHARVGAEEFKLTKRSGDSAGIRLCCIAMPRHRKQLGRDSSVAVARFLQAYLDFHKGLLAVAWHCGVHDMSTLCAHLWTHVLYMNPERNATCGHFLLESQCSMLGKDRSFLLDLTRLIPPTDGGGGALPLRKVVELCAQSVRPPLLPSDFDAMLHDKVLDETSDQLTLLGTRYRTMFARQLGALQTLRCARLGWGDAEAISLARVLACGAAPLLTRLELGENEIGDDGCTALAAACVPSESDEVIRKEESAEDGTDGGSAGGNDHSSLPKLESLDLEKNRIGDAGGVRLVQTIREGRLPSLKKLELLSNQLSDATFAEVADALRVGGKGLARLEELHLGGNRMSDGMEATLRTAAKQARGVKIYCVYGDYD